jgi:hypothetical protein
VTTGTGYASFGRGRHGVPVSAFVLVAFASPEMHAPFQLDLVEIIRQRYVWLAWGFDLPVQPAGGLRQ